MSNSTNERDHMFLVWNPRRGFLTSGIEAPWAEYSNALVYAQRFERIEDARKWVRDPDRILILFPNAVSGPIIRDWETMKSLPDFMEARA